MIDLVDPVQRHIAAIVFRDIVVPDDASDMALCADASPKQVERQLRAMLAGVDVPWNSGNGMLDDPVGRRVGRAAFNSAIRALWTDGVWTAGTLAPLRLPEDAGGIERFIREQTLLRVGDPDDASGDDLVEQLLGFSIADHARISDILRADGWRARLFVAASIIAAAGASYEAKRRKSDKTGRNKGAVALAALGIDRSRRCSADCHAHLPVGRTPRRRTPDRDDACGKGRALPASTGDQDRRVFDQYGRKCRRSDPRLPQARYDARHPAQA